MNVHVPYTHAGRVIGVDTALTSCVLLSEQLNIDEGVNALFLIEAAIRSQRDDLQAGDFVDPTVDVRLKLADGGTCWWNALVTQPTLQSVPVESMPDLVNAEANVATADCIRRGSDAGSPFVKA